MNRILGFVNALRNCNTKEIIDWRKDNMLRLANERETSTHVKEVHRLTSSGATVELWNGTTKNITTRELGTCAHISANYAQEASALMDLMNQVHMLHTDRKINRLRHEIRVANIHRISNRVYRKVFRRAVLMPRIKVVQSMLPPTPVISLLLSTDLDLSPLTPLS